MIYYLEHHLVDHCNLKCAGCSHFSPLAPQWFETIEDFERDFTQLQKIATGKQKVKVIRLMGGEPLLHPQVGEFLTIIRQLFPESAIELVTNGLLFKQRKNELLECINNNRIQISFTDYGLIQDFNKIFEGIKLYHHTSRSDMYNISLDLEGKQNRQSAFELCKHHYMHCYYFQFGKFYPCCVAANINIFNTRFGTNLPQPEGYSIYDHTEQEILTYLKTPIQLCEYCNTAQRPSTYHPFRLSHGEITEWICQ